jgi:hypothetical protein
MRDQSAAQQNAAYSITSSAAQQSRAASFNHLLGERQELVRHRKT